MVYRSIGRIAAVVALVALATAPTRQAAACSLTCIQTLVRPTTTVPANAPAIAVYVFQSEFHLQLDELYTMLLLRDAKGNVVPVTYEALTTSNYQLPVLLRPDTPLAPNAMYYVDYAVDCDGTSALSPFTTRAAEEHPTSAGTLSVGPSSRQTLAIASSAASCRTPVEVSAATLTFTPSPELERFLPLARFTTTIDGETWANSRFGETESPVGPFARSPMALHSTCGKSKGDYDGTDQGLTAGHHTGALTVEIAGMTPLPALPFEVEIDCPKSGCAVVRGDWRADGVAWLVVLGALWMRARRRGQSVTA